MPIEATRRTQCPIDNIKVAFELFYSWVYLVVTLQSEHLKLSLKLSKAN